MDNRDLQVLGSHIQERIDELADQLDRERRHWDELLAAIQWGRMKDRFYAFDAIRNDACPSCGARVIVEETHNAVRLKAVDSK